MTSSSCKVCRKLFNDTKTSRETRVNLLKRKSVGDKTIIERLNEIGFIINNSINNNNNNQQDNQFSYICRPCETKLSTLEKANEIKRQWSIEESQFQANHYQNQVLEINCSSPAPCPHLCCMCVFSMFFYLNTFCFCFSFI